MIWQGVIAAVFLADVQVVKGSTEGLTAPFVSPAADFGAAGQVLKVASWNVAAVNNNPFEYWITHPDPRYKQLMEKVESFIVKPADKDVRVDLVFTDAMFRRLLANMEKVGLPELAVVEKMWEADYRSRKVVSEFLRDATIGKKRLASMPDRVTNTIQLPSGESVFRPTVINCYTEELGTLEAWFEKWLGFFFESPVDVDGKGEKPVYSLLQRIKKAKYPAVTAEEEAASVPLQLLLQGIFDAILVHLMRTKGGDTWHQLRSEICSSLNRQKNDRISEILRTTYAEVDVVFMQEVGSQLVSRLLKQSSAEFHVVTPKKYDAKRNQNSVILLRRSLFSEPKELEISGEKVGWEAGDLLALVSKLGQTEIALASFHGDTNGLLTIPMLKEVFPQLPTERLIFGLDANTYERVSSSSAHVLDFEETYQKLGLKACWGAVNPSRYTTFNARTYLQPQLNKAAKSDELALKGDRNPKDFILFSPHFKSGRFWRDNTGKGKYEEDVVFPTLEFPSDHAVIATELVLPESPKQSEFLFDEMPQRLLVGSLSLLVGATLLIMLRPRFCGQGFSSRRGVKSASPGSNAQASGAREAQQCTCCISFWRLWSRL
mmetsp:Transcript_4165/g.7391  ORF Transcript_4165/g.7391 Transcript_4165/m.7391 type:complete len:603 (-) Transcript_4165:13-1821(-)